METNQSQKKSKLPSKLRRKKWKISISSHRGQALIEALSLCSIIVIILFLGFKANVYFQQLFQQHRFQ